MSVGREETSGGTEVGLVGPYAVIGGLVIQIINGMHWLASAADGKHISVSGSTAARSEVASAGNPEF